MIVPGTFGAQPVATGNASVAMCRHLARYGAGVGGAVLPEEEHRDRVHLEVEVRRQAARVAGVAHEADHLARPDVRAVRGERRERGEVRVEELVSLAVAEPEAVAGRVVPADRVERPGGHRDERLAEAAEDVDPVLPGIVLPARPVPVDRRGRPVDREDVRAGRGLRGDQLRHGHERRGYGRVERRAVEQAAARGSGITGGAVFADACA